MPDNHNEELDTYTIPPNFMESGTLFGGAFKLRNALEAGAIVLAVGLPVFRLPLSLTTRIIILCLTAMPLGLIALIGVSGESLSSFVFNFFRFLKRRRVVSQPAESSKPSESDHPKGRKLRSSRIQTPAEYFPIQKIQHGVLYTRDHRYVKVLEVTPINFLLRSAREQRNILYSYVHYLKISPVKVQMKVLTKKADVNRHLESVRREFQAETDEKCRELQKDYEDLIRRIGSKEAITRRFFLIFEYESFGRHESEEEALSALMTAEQTARTYLLQCGNKIAEPESEDEAAVEILYELLNRKTSAEKPLSVHSSEVIARHLFKEGEDAAGRIPAADFFAPSSLDFRHAHYVMIDGTYYAYLLIPSSGYKPRVAAGWLSILVNAGEGVDVDMFLFRQPKEQVIRKLGQQLRINRSKIRETSDTNTDFDDLEGAIRSGYFLKEGLAANEDFYYFSTLITVTASSLKELNWRIAELKKLMVSQDLNIAPCTFRQEDAFLSSLPLVSLEKHLYARSRRNMLTLGAASCYPYTSYELCDDNGILFGVNKHNSSLVIADIFDSKQYKNSNICILGCSGAGKTFTMQTMALRMRRKGIQVFIIAPLKGHEFYRACKNVGGEFIQISPASRNCINIMEIRKVDNSVNELLDGPTMDASALASKIQKLHIFFSLLIPDMSHEEKQLLDESLIKTYARKGITHKNESLLDPQRPNQYKEMPILEDVYDVLMENPDTKRLAHILNRLVHGSASSFNQKTNVDLSNKYTVLDISELTGSSDLLTVGMFVALDYVWDKAKENRTEEKAVFVDEVWQLIGASSNRLAAEFVLEIAKVIRAYSGAGIFATQDLNDFFALDDGKYGKGIINNCKTKIILNMEDEEAQRVKNILHLSETEVMNITHFQRGNGLISTNNNNITVEFKASTLEKELITTDRQELLEILERQKRKIG